MDRTAKSFVGTLGEDAEPFHIGATLSWRWIWPLTLWLVVAIPLEREAAVSSRVEGGSRGSARESRSK